MVLVFCREIFFKINVCFWFCFLNSPFNNTLLQKCLSLAVKYLNTKLCVSSSYSYTCNVLRSVVFRQSVYNAVMARSFAGLEASERRRLFYSCWEPNHDPTLQCVEYPVLRKYLGTYMCKGKSLSLNMPCRHRRRVKV